MWRRLGHRSKGIGRQPALHRKARFTVWGVNLGPDNVGIAERLGLLVGDSPLLREDPLVDTVLMVADSEGRPLSPLVCAEQEATVRAEGACRCSQLVAPFCLEWFWVWKHGLHLDLARDAGRRQASCHAYPFPASVSSVAFETVTRAAREGGLSDTRWVQK